MSIQQNIAFGVLAGGKSSRMGRDKAAMQWMGSTFLDTVLSAGDGFPERLVSLSAAADPAVAARLAAAGIEVVWDETEDAGPMEGIRQILRHAKCDACLITATDMPFLTGELLTYLAERYAGRGNLALTCRGLTEPLCSIYARDCLPAIEDLRKENRRRPALLFERVETVFLPLEETGFSEKLLCNINCAEDYEGLLAAGGGR